jgi:hypothetical protein
MSKKAALASSHSMELRSGDGAASLAEEAVGTTPALGVSSVLAITPPYLKTFIMADIKKFLRDLEVYRLHVGTLRAPLWPLKAMMDEDLIDALELQAVRNSVTLPNEGDVAEWEAAVIVLLKRMVKDDPALLPVLSETQMKTTVSNKLSWDDKRSFVDNVLELQRSFAVATAKRVNAQINAYFRLCWYW